MAVERNLVTDPAFLFVYPGFGCVRQHLALVVRRVVHDPRDHERQARAPRDVDRDVRALVGMDAAQEDQRPVRAAGPDRHVLDRDAVVHRRLPVGEGAVGVDEPRQGALHLAERFRRELEQEPLQLPALSLSITCSIGVGDYLPLCDDSPEAFYKRVDDALYQAKSKGRNRVELA